MRKFKDVPSLHNAMVESILRAIKGDLTRICEQVAQRHIMDAYMRNVFEYNRTWEFRDSLTIGTVVQSGTSVTFEIYMDPNKINPVQTPPGEWNIHMDVWGNDQSHMIPVWMEDGTNGGLFPRPGGEYMANTHSELDNGVLVKALRNALSKSGFTVRVL